MLSMMGLNTHGLVPMKLAYSPHVLSSVVVVHEVRAVCVYKTCPVYSSGGVVVLCVYSSGGVVCVH